MRLVQAGHRVGVVRQVKDRSEAQVWGGKAGERQEWWEGVTGWG